EERPLDAPSLCGSRPGHHWPTTEGCPAKTPARLTRHHRLQPTMRCHPAQLTVDLTKPLVEGGAETRTADRKMRQDLSPRPEDGNQHYRARRTNSRSNC